MNDDLVERLKEARWMLQSGGLSRASNSVLEAIAELTRLRKENEELRGKVSQLKAHLGFWTAAFDDINSLAEPTEGGTPSSKSTEERL